MEQTELPEVPEEVRAIMEEFELVEEALNVKVLMNIYMKNLRFISHDPETSIENLKKVIILSSHVCGEDVKYKHS